MVFKYKRKTIRGSWGEQTMQKAINEAKTTTISAASKKYAIPIGTLHRHIKKGDASKKLGRFKPVFSRELEQELCDLAIERDTLFYGLTKDSLQTLAYELATQNKIAHPFACEEGDNNADNDITEDLAETTAFAEVHENFLLTRNEDDGTSKENDCAENSATFNGNSSVTECHESASVNVFKDKNEKSNDMTVDENEVMSVNEKEVVLNEQQDCQKKTLEDKVDAPSSGPFDIFAQPSTSYIISPRQILPSPKVTPSIKKRKIRSQTSEILTSSPFKSIIEKKNDTKKKPKLDLDQTSKGKENEYEQKRPEQDLKEKGKGKGKGKRTKKDEKILQNQKQSSQEDVICLFCGEQYIDPPTEDWLQCPSCHGWAHELCTDTDNNYFLCVNCKM